MEGDRGSKRQRHSHDEYRNRRDDESLETNASWRSLLLYLGDHCAEYNFVTDVGKQLETCATILKKDLSNISEDALTLLLDCAEELPHKAPMYATLVGLLNAENLDFAAQVVHGTHLGLQSALDKGEMNKLRLLLRFLSLLMVCHVVSPATVVEVYDMFLASAAAIVDEDGGNPAWQPRADFYVHCVLASLPFCSIELSQQAPEELDRFLTPIEAYMSLRTPLQRASLQCLQPLRTVTQEDPLEDLLVRIRSLQQNQWRADSVWRTHEDYIDSFSSAPFHEMASLVRPPVPPLPSPVTTLAVSRQRFEALQAYPPRVGRLKIFPPSKTDDTMTPMDRFVVEEYLLDVLHYLNGCRKECTGYLVGLPVPFRYEYIMAETVFSQLLLLPKPPFQLIYYTVIMVDLCKALPGAFPAVVAGAVKLLFDNLTALDVECRYRLVQWLSHHLSNFQFVWPWDSWSHVLEKPPWHPQRFFVTEVLDKEIRLAYWDKVKESLKSDRMVGLLPPQPNPHFKYSSANEGGASEVEVGMVEALTQKVRAKSSIKEMLVWVGEVLTPAVGPTRALDLTAQTLLNLGAKSFTHTMTALERYTQLLRKMAPTQEKQVALLGSAVELWSNSSQMAAVVVDRCMGFRIVSNLAITQWAFSPPCQRIFHTSDLIWEILRNALNKTNNRTIDLRKEVVSAETASVSATSAASKAREDANEAMALVESSETEETKSQALAKAEWANGRAEKAAEEATSAQETAEAKQFSLQRALEEQENLYLSLLGNFASVLTQKMTASETGVPGESRKEGGEGEGEGEGPVPMEADGEENALQNEGEDIDANGEGGNARRHHRKERGGREEGVNGILNGGEGPEHMGDDKMDREEEKAWIEFTLSQFRSICRHYAREIWPLMEKVESRVFTKEVDGKVLEAAYEGLGYQRELKR